MFTHFSTSLAQLLLVANTMSIARTVVTVDDGVVVGAGYNSAITDLAAKSIYFQAYLALHYRGHNSFGKKQGHQDMKEVSCDKQNLLQY